MTRWMLKVVFSRPHSDGTEYLAEYDDERDTLRAIQDHERDGLTFTSGTHTVHWPTRSIQNYEYWEETV